MKEIDLSDIHTNDTIFTACFGELKVNYSSDFSIYCGVEDGQVPINLSYNVNGKRWHDDIHPTAFHDVDELIEYYSQFRKP